MKYCGGLITEKGIRIYWESSVEMGPAYSEVDVLFQIRAKNSTIRINI